MTDEHEQVLDMIEDAIGALVVQKHGPGRLIGVCRDTYRGDIEDVD